MTILGIMRTQNERNLQNKNYNKILCIPLYMRHYSPHYIAQNTIHSMTQNMFHYIQSNYIYRLDYSPWTLFLPLGQ